MTITLNTAKYAHFLKDLTKRYYADFRSSRHEIVVMEEIETAQVDDIDGNMALRFGNWGRRA